MRLEREATGNKGVRRGESGSQTKVYIPSIYIYISYTGYRKEMRPPNRTRKNCSLRMGLVWILDCEKMSKERGSLDRRIGLAHLVRGYPLMAPTLSPGNAASKSSRFPADSQSIPSKFQGNNGISKTSLESEYYCIHLRVSHWGYCEMSARINPHPTIEICSCIGAKFYRSLVLGLSRKEFESDSLYSLL